MAKKQIKKQTEDEEVTEVEIEEAYEKGSELDTKVNVPEPIVNKKKIWCH